MDHSKYILGGDDGRTPVPVDLMTWARWFETADRRIAVDALAEHLTVSTVFLGVDHNFSGAGPPLLFETMVLDESGDAIWCERAPSWKDAEVCHARGRTFAMSQGTDEQGPSQKRRRMAKAGKLAEFDARVAELMRFAHPRNEAMSIAYNELWRTWTPARKDPAN